MEGRSRQLLLQADYSQNTHSEDDEWNGDISPTTGQKLVLVSFSGAGEVNHARRNEHDYER